MSREHIRARALAGGPLATGPTHLQFLGGNQATARLFAQREGSTETGVENKEGEIDGEFVGAYSQAERLLLNRCAELDREREGMTREGSAPPPGLFALAAEGRQLAQTVQAGGSGKLDAVTYDQVAEWAQKAAGAMAISEAMRVQLAGQKLREVQNVAKAAKQRLAETKEKIDNQRAAAYLADEADSVLSKLWSWSTVTLDCGLEIEPVIAGAQEMEQNLVNLARGAAAQAGPNVGRIKAAYQLPEGSTLMPLLQNVNNVINGFQAVQAAAGLLSGGKTAGAKASSDIGSLVDLATSIDGFIGLSGGMALYMNLYLTPMTAACLDALNKLRELARQISLEAIRQGNYDAVNWDEIPGKRPMFDFMLAVRDAGSPADVPAPVPPMVARYMTDNHESISAGTTSGQDSDDLPTTGMWFWREVDDTKISKWVFEHRSDLWAIFYGSTVPNSV